MTRMQRLEELQRAQALTLAYIHRLGRVVKAHDARTFALKAIKDNVSRREDVWTTLVNAGFVEMRGRGNYAITASGLAQMAFWINEFKITPLEIDHIISETIVAV